ncbi:MAG: hypothetical protein EOP68_04230 [Sphingomonas sp.]|nr:MAG: hypothetical protein EOP68_04230 [Sphingomonas sp.]
MNDAAPVVRTARMRTAILLGLPLLGWATVRTTALTMFAEDRPGLAMLFAPAGAAALANAAQMRIVEAGGTVDAVARAQTAAALQRAPRDAAPLILAGLAASADGAADRAQALMEAAQARDPRAGIARYWLLDHYVRTGQGNAALAEVGPALRLRPGTRTAIFALVSAMAASPDMRGPVHTALARDPDWRESFFAVQATADVDPVLLLHLLATLPPPADPSSRARERRVVVLAAVRAGAYGEAQALWQSARPETAREAGLVHDPMFRRPLADMPFDWSAPDVAGMQAQTGRDGLTVAYRGETPATVAQQLVPGAGRYRLSARATGGVEVRLSCARDESPLASVPVGGGTVDATIPATCGAAWLRVVATPGDTGAVNATIADVRLFRA